LEFNDRYAAWPYALKKLVFDRAYRFYKRGEIWIRQQ
jgi:hypothetical protein